LSGLLGLKAMDNPRQMQRLAQLTRDKDVLAHYFATMGSGGQHAVQSRCGLKGGFHGKLFVIQTLNLFNE
jgi:hypothetical protein